MVRKSTFFLTERQLLGLAVIGSFVILFCIMWQRGCGDPRPWVAVVVEPIAENLPPETSSNEPRRIVLLGDSILANRSYVPSGKSVEDLLKQTGREKGWQVEMLAEDGATIEQVWLQLPRIPAEYNTPTTSIVLSVGGNDFLTGGDVRTMERAYGELLQQIRQQFGSCKLYLVNLYQPIDAMFVVIYARIIAKWNQFLLQVVEKGLADGVIDIFTVITQPEDLVVKIEPSASGGAKIVAAIVEGVGV
jgi:hypothetical protein